MDLRVVVGENVRALRGLTPQDEVAHDAGIHTTYLSGIENGKRNISLRVLGRLAAALGVTEAELFRRRERSTDRDVSRAARATTLYGAGRGEPRPRPSPLRGLGPFG